MANLGTFEISNKEYQDLDVIIGEPLQESVKHSIQVQSGLFACPKASKPNEKEGFYLSNTDLVYYFTPQNGEKLWVKCYIEPAKINVSY